MVFYETAQKTKRTKKLYKLETKGVNEITINDYQNIN